MINTTDNPLEQFIENHVLNIKEFPAPNKKTKATQILGTFSGFLSGIPWIEAASKAAIIFPVEEGRGFFSIVFSAGIVVTVGFDGGWVMSDVTHMLDPYTPEERLMKSDSLSVRRGKTGLVSLLSALTSIPAVYASFNYNTGSAKALALIIVIVHFGYGFYGYSKTIDGLHNLCKALFNHNEAELHKIRDNLYRCIEEERRLVLTLSHPFLTSSASSLLTSRAPSSQEYLQELLANLPQRSKNFKKFILQLIGASIIPLSSSIVGVFLSRNFWKNIWDMPAFYWTLTAMGEIPSFFISALSTYEVLGNFYEMLAGALSCKTISELKHIYPKASLIAPFIAFICSLIAPAAGAYITYETLKEGEVSPEIQWIATLSVIAARITFSNFTINRLSKRLMRWFASRSEANIAEAITLSRSFERLQDALPSIKLEYLEKFKEEKVPHPLTPISPTYGSLLVSTRQIQTPAATEEAVGPKTKRWCTVL